MTVRDVDIQIALCRRLYDQHWRHDSERCIYYRLRLEELRALREAVIMEQDNP